MVHEPGAKVRLHDRVVGSAFEGAAKEGLVAAPTGGFVVAGEGKECHRGDGKRSARSGGEAWRIEKRRKQDAHQKSETNGWQIKVAVVDVIVDEREHQVERKGEEKEEPCDCEDCDGEAGRRFLPEMAECQRENACEQNKRHKGKQDFACREGTHNRELVRDGEMKWEEEVPKVKPHQARFREEKKLETVEAVMAFSKDTESSPPHGKVRGGEYEKCGKPRDLMTARSHGLE